MYVKGNTLVDQNVDLSLTLLLFFYSNFLTGQSTLQIVI